VGSRKARHSTNPHIRYYDAWTVCIYTLDAVYNKKILYELVTGQFLLLAREPRRKSNKLSKITNFYFYFIDYDFITC